MNSRERFLKTINKEEKPDRPPVFANLVPQVAEKLSEAMGMEYEPPVDSMLGVRISHPQLLNKLGNDCVGIASCAPVNAPTVTDKNGIITNEWGMKFKPFGMYNELYEFPLANAENVQDIEKYTFPDPDARGRYDHAKGIIQKYGNDYGIVADLETSILETSWYLLGLEKFLMDLIMEKSYVFALMDKVMEINTQIGKRLIELGPDMIWAGDDFGTQHGMLVDPEIWRKHFKPRIKYMFDEFRSVNPDIKIAWHSCGSITEIIPDFIELGLDALNPLQPLAKDMTPENLTEKYIDDLIFFGGIDIQELLPHGSPEEIKKEVKRRAQIYGSKGNYIIAPAHTIQLDTPLENIFAFFDAVKEL
ncbi:MAG: hypothetical protein KGY69_09145 [Bacteroidales bacterium]|nr:hypothetical protein [Bacteroidales bacterium]